MPDDIFFAVTGLRISPDNQSLIFAASGPPQKKLPGAQLPIAQSDPGTRLPVAQSESGACAVGVWFICFVSRASANGLPWDLWQVSTDGKTYKQLTRLQLDSPWPAVSKDGRTVAFISLNGLFLLDRQTNEVKLLDQEGGHGVMDWYQP